MKDYIKELTNIFKKRDLSLEDDKMLALLHTEMDGAMGYDVGSPERTNAIANSVKILSSIKNDSREDKTSKSESRKRIFDMGIEVLKFGGTLALGLFSILLGAYLESNGVLSTVSYKEARSGVNSICKDLSKKK